MNSGFRVCLVAVLLLTLVQCAGFPQHAPNAPAQETVIQQQAANIVTATVTPLTPTTVFANPTSLPTPTERVIPTATPRPEAPPLSNRFRAQPGDRVKEITPGVIHIARSTDAPLKINILLFDITKPQFDIKTAIGDGWLSGRYRTSQLAAQYDALAAVNGDLFSADGIPQGLTIVDSQVAIAPKYRATFAWGNDRKPFIGYFTNYWTWNAEAVAPSGSRMPISYLNIICDPGQLCLYNDLARGVPARPGDVKALLDKNNRVTAIVGETRTRVLTGTHVLQGTGAGARWLLKNLEEGDTVDINIKTQPPLSNYTQAISGGPIILQDDQFVQDCLCALDDCSGTEEQGLYCEDFTTDWKLHHYLWVRMPRTGIGYDKEKQTLIVAIVDGYQRGYSRGATQAEFAALLREFGAHTAMELDGGGSSTMVLRNKVVNQPPDDTGERYVANALLFFWKERRPMPKFDDPRLSE
jgi:hypothetical protein